MKLEFVTVISMDDIELPALLYAPKNTKKVAIFLHGNGDSGVFYKEAMINVLAAELAKKDIGLLALNNRGARYKKKLIVHGSGSPGQEETVTGGAHYELIKDCVKDIDGSIEFLESRGFKEFYIIGFSTGANKICVYEELVPNNKISKYVHAGPGDDSGLFFNEIGENRFWLSLKFSKDCIEANNPLKIMPKYTGMNPFSAQSAFDILDPDGLYNTFPYFEATQKRLGKKELFKEYKKIKKPMLVVFGDNDEFTYTGGGTQLTLDLLKKMTHKMALPSSDFQIIKDTDHGFHGAEDELAVRIADWLVS